MIILFEKLLKTLLPISRIIRNMNSFSIIDFKAKENKIRVCRAHNLHVGIHSITQLSKQQRSAMFGPVFSIHGEY